MINRVRPGIKIHKVYFKVLVRHLLWASLYVRRVSLSLSTVKVMVIRMLGASTAVGIQWESRLP